MKKHLLVIPIALALGACGGGGSGDLVRAPVSSTGTDTQTSNVSVEPATGEANSGETIDSGEGNMAEVVPESTVDNTSQLLTTKSFDFKTQWEMAIDFDIGDAKAKDGFLSICSEYEFDGENAYDINFEKCAVRSSISNGVFNGKLNVTNDVEGLVAVIWFAEELEAPLYYEFELVNGQESISWR